MIPASSLLDELVARGITMVSGVPCSFLTPVINRAISHPTVRYVVATQEGEAAAITAGAWLGGGLGCAIGQNSGLGNMVNPLTSLMRTASIPILLLVTWRGEPGRKDEPQHELMGRATTGLLDLMEIPWDLMPDDPERLPRILDCAWRLMQTGRRPYAVVIPKGTVCPEPLDEPEARGSAATVVRAARPPQRPTRAVALTALLAVAPRDMAIITTTGFTSRELYAIDDRESNFYLVGAMGSAAAVGLGVALHSPRPVLVVDGDGALLMRLGSLATVGAYRPDNLIHVVLDNGQHESTGGQRTVSGSVDIVGVAAACGFHRVVGCSTVDDMTDAVTAALRGRGPTLIHIPIRPGVLEPLGRPKISPTEVAQRFRAFVSAPVSPPVLGGGLSR